MTRISVIVPTLNEADNVGPLVEAIDRALDEAGLHPFEIVIMDDDSRDGTADRVAALGNPRVRLVNRAGRMRGLAAAVIDGFGEARGEVLAVMDADFSHPPAVLTSLVTAVLEGTALAVGSRYVPGGAVEDWPRWRRFASWLACVLARPVTPVRDATSGFFACRRDVVEGVPLSPHGFKIGLEVIVKGRHGGRVRELPYVFTDRRHGKSKFGPATVLWYLRQLLSLLGT